MKISLLTNNDTRLQAKMRYFSNYFLFANDYLGKFPNLPFDNPISYVNKIIFQIEHNLVRCPKFIDVHLDNLLVFYEGYLLEYTKGFAHVSPSLRSYQNSASKVAYIKKNPEFLQRLKDLLRELEATLFETNFALLYKYMVCGHSLEHHQSDIESTVQVLVSTFRLNGHSQQEVSEYIDRILSKDAFRFPLPPELQGKGDADERKLLVKEFFSQRDFKKQFEGLQNILTTSKIRTGIFIYAIEDVKLEKELHQTFKVTFDKVTFISPYHKDLQYLNKLIYDSDQKKGHVKTLTRFFGDNIMLAYVELPYEFMKYAFEAGSKIVQEELRDLNQYLGTKLFVNDVDALYVNGIGSDEWSSRLNLKNKTVVINAYKFDKISSNAFQLLKKSGSLATAQVLHSEHVFRKAFEEDSISSYWQYIENLFWFQDVDNKKETDYSVKILMNLLQSLREEFVYDFGNALYQITYNYVKGENGLTRQEFEQLRTEIMENKNAKFPINDYFEKMQEPFLKQLIGFHQLLWNETYKKEWEKYFSNLLLELYEYRNADWHTGRVNSFSRIKLNDLIPITMNRVRWYIVRLCANNPALRFAEIIDKIIR